MTSSTRLPQAQKRFRHESTGPHGPTGWGHPARQTHSFIEFPFPMGQLLDAQKHIYKSMSAYYQHIELFLLSLQNITESAAVLANYPMRYWLQHKVLHS